jgi:hypothetical protein
MWWLIDKRLMMSCSPLFESDISPVSGWAATGGTILGRGPAFAGCRRISTKRTYGPSGTVSELGTRFLAFDLALSPFV